MALGTPRFNSWMNFLTKEESLEVGERAYSFYSIPDLPDIEPRDGDKDHTVSYGDTVDRLSVRYYGDQAWWWVIARRNNLSWPEVELAQRQSIVIPDPNFVKSRMIRR